MESCGPRLCRLISVRRDPIQPKCERAATENLADQRPTRCGLVTRARESDLAPSELDALWDRLRRVPRFLRHYGWWKTRFDPAYPCVLSQIRDCRDVLDLGAGMGLMEVLFAGRFPGARIRGVEWDERKVSAARNMLDGFPRATVEHGDACQVALGSPDAVLLIDLLHYMDRAAQANLLERCAASLNRHGILVIRELDRSRARREIAETLERIAVRVGWNRGAGVQVTPLGEMVSLLQDHGFRVEVRPSGRGVFSGNVLIVARKRGRSTGNSTATGPAEM
jgi:predicted O-methyltransferase YrrM